MSYIKLISKFIEIPLTHIFNKCILYDYFQNCLKNFKIIVLYKSGKKDILGNDRPISLFPQISNILEKIIKSRLTAYINKHNVLNCNQFGSRSNRSTADAIDNLNYILVNNLDNKVNYLAVSIDLKKAFDTLNTNILLNN